MENGEVLERRRVHMERVTSAAWVQVLPDPSVAGVDAAMRYEDRTVRHTPMRRVETMPSQSSRKYQSSSAPLEGVQKIPSLRSVALHGCAGGTAAAGPHPRAQAHRRTVHGAARGANGHAHAGHDDGCTQARREPRRRRGTRPPRCSRRRQPLCAVHHRCRCDECSCACPVVLAPSPLALPS